MVLLLPDDGLQGMTTLEAGTGEAEVGVGTEGEEVDVGLLGRAVITPSRPFPGVILPLGLPRPGVFCYNGEIKIKKDMQVFLYHIQVCI